MPSAKLIKSLERRGFLLEFPDYETLEEEIIEILREENPRILLSLPILLTEKFDYKKICLKINSFQKSKFNRIILISRKIYEKESIESNFNKVIKENKIKASFSKLEFKDYYDAFKEAKISLGKTEQKSLEKQSKLRLNLDMNKDMKTLFSPAKIIIIKKIFNHEKLTNSELKYYYRAISNINKAVLNQNLQDYLKVIELTKKIV